MKSYLPLILAAIMLVVSTTAILVGCANNSNLKFEEIMTYPVTTPYEVVDYPVLPAVTTTEEVQEELPEVTTEAVTEATTESTTEAVTTTEEVTTTEATTEVTTEATTEATTTTEAVTETTAKKDDALYNSPEDYFFICNKEIRLPENYSFETMRVQEDYELEITAAKACLEMLAAAEKDGIKLHIISAYRTFKYQEKLFDRNVNSRIENGMSYQEAVYDTSISIAPAGGSEHNAGLAVDIVPIDKWNTYTAFEKTEEFAWLQENAHKYGFILRYLKGKEDITGYIYEPWHWRYIGVDYAEEVKNSGLCLEEYFEVNNLTNRF